MADPVVLDAGPLVALLDRKDPWHAWVSAQMDLNGRQTIPLIHPAS